MKDIALERAIIEYCAPTLAGIKSASLFSYFYKDKYSVEKQLQEMNELLTDKGVCVEPLIWRDESVLIYTYRQESLQRELMQEDIKKILDNFGYVGCRTDECIMCLKERLKESGEFPHEIGCFLGYPSEDVTGFIENKGKNCKYCGLWKVYSKEVEKIKHFEKLQKCTQVYLRVFAEGRSITQMTVPV